jgi:hypothetical protein
MFDKLKNTIKAEAQKEAQKLQKALDDTKKGVKGAKEKAKELAEDLAKNTAVTPLLPMLPAMLYLLKKEKGLTYSAKEIATKRYVIVQDFYNKIVEPHFNPKPSNVATKKKKLSSFDMIEMTQSDFDHVDEATAFVPGDTTTSDATATSALNEVFSSAIDGGTQGAKIGASLGTFLGAAGVPPPVSNLAGASAGAQLGVIVASIIKFFKLGLTKVKDALDKTKTQADAITSGNEITSEEISPAGAFDFKKLLLPLLAVVAIYFFVIKNK